MNETLLTALLVYLVSIANLLIGAYLFRKSTSINDETKKIVEETSKRIDEKTRAVLESRKQNINIRFVMMDDMDMMPDDETMRNIMHPANIVRDMDYDDFMDWLDIGGLDDVLAARDAFNECGMMQHVNIIDSYIKNKYPNLK